MKNKFLIVLSLSFAILILGWISYLVIIPNFKNKEIIIPDISNIEINDAYNLLRDNKLNVKIVSIEEECGGKALYTVPSKGTSIYKGSLVYLYVSTKLPPIKQSFLNKEYNDYVVDYINRNGFELKVDFLSLDMESGIIIDEEYIDNTYKIKVSKGMDDLIIEDFRGYSLNKLNSLLETHKIKARYDFTYSPFPFGYVINQNVLAGIIGYNSPYELNFEISRGLY